MIKTEITNGRKITPPNFNFSSKTELLLSINSRDVKKRTTIIRESIIRSITIVARPDPDSRSSSLAMSIPRAGSPIRPGIKVLINIPMKE